MDSYLIRKGTSDELALAVALWSEAQSARRGSPSTSPDMLELETTRLTSERAVFLVMQEEGNVIAFALASPARADWGAGEVIAGIAHISSVAVKPSRWGHGLGLKLMEALTQELARLGYLRAQLWTQPSNQRAVKLYLKLGFQFTGDERRDDNGERIRRYVLDLV